MVDILPQKGNEEESGEEGREEGEDRGQERGEINGAIRYKVFRIICLKDVLDGSLVGKLCNLLEDKENRWWFAPAKDHRGKGGREWVKGGYWHEQGAKTKEGEHFFEHKHSSFIRKERKRTKEGGKEGGVGKEGENNQQKEWE